MPCDWLHHEFTDVWKVGIPVIFFRPPWKICICNHLIQDVGANAPVRLVRHSERVWEFMRSAWTEYHEVARVHPHPTTSFPMRQALEERAGVYG